MNYKKKAKKIDVPGILLGLATILVLGFILTPIWITIIVSFNAGDFIVFPPTGFSLKWYKAFATDYMWILAFKNSLLIAIPTMVVSTVVGVLAALGYMKRQFKLRNVINLLVLLPFLVPGIIIGICLLMFVHKIGLAGTYAAVVAGHALWGIPQRCFYWFRPCWPDTTLVWKMQPEIWAPARSKPSF